MQIEIDGKKHKVPDGEILRLRQKMGITTQEAVKIYLEDEGILHNEEQEALCKKAKESGIMRTIHGASAKDPSKPKTQSERVKKENPTKEMIINRIAEILPEFAENITITNKGKLIEFTVGENSYKLDLVQKRKPKN